ncbi:ribosome silencing factor [Phormidium tenue]|uniref:Ribosomal silencing factor RsfS n=1 Tax=Phormidium tenue NIES-30 TaxID=549789 RepID=A0A1U7J9L2_9CYAN|nr:ribosome silencing factor [Phormidium tenue]MBD2230746.1 ribosome silencing factor [Phormidium tenue FACHB-1052]OKH50197.1 ribosome silencing factor [Phormidium tenue NIES-30]
MTQSSHRQPAATDAPAPNQTEDDALNLAYAIAAAADERKAGNITILQVGDVSYLADYFVVATGFSAVQVRAITRSIEASLETDYNRRPLRVEGQGEGSWIVMDYGEVIAHIFMPEARDYYDLEAFWGHANQILYQPSGQHFSPAQF